LPVLVGPRTARIRVLSLAARGCAPDWTGDQAMATLRT